MFNTVEYSFQFEAGVRAKCPSPCHFHHYQPDIVTSATSYNHHLVSSAKVKGGTSGVSQSNVDTLLKSRMSNVFASVVHADDVATLEIRDRLDDWSYSKITCMTVIHFSIMLRGRNTINMKEP